MVFVWFLGVAAKDDCTLPQEKVWEIQILERGNYFFVFFWGRLDRSHFTLPQKEVLEIQVLEGRNYSICLSLFWLAPHGTISWREHESFMRTWKFSCASWKVSGGGWFGSSAGSWTYSTDAFEVHAKVAFVHCHKEKLRIPGSGQGKL